MGVDLIKIKTAHRNQVENEPFFCSILIIHGYFVCSFIRINTFERIAVNTICSDSGCEECHRYKKAGR